ncbi:hypothetical protein B7019_0981 [Bifidobacterium breve JCM 7019]|uniref:hypothetical protein n=1 Tax=Bifidobacterium breve TaxID=1685 RepID=UPI0003EFB9AF|nr:hypothetical protein [Bifidobacterium breve]AHJ19262.1 hypothetical protein B7019_0981 [Bifidobacterium breve JCM 7019]
MEIRNLVEQSATVTRVQTLHMGDIYKRVEEDDNSNATVIIGKVMDIGSNGEQTVVSVIEAKKDRWGNNVIVESVAFTGNKDMTLFPVDDLEIRVIAAPLFQRLADSLRDAEEKIKRTQEKRSLLQQILETENAE